MEFDADRRVVGGAVVKLLESSAYFPGLYPHYRIVAGGVPNWTLKEVYSDRTFFQSLMSPFQAVPHHVRKKLLASLAWLKIRTVQDRIQFTQDGLLFTVIEGAVITMRHFAPNWICCRTHRSHRLPHQGASDRASRKLRSPHTS
jgi:hypothetical protein